MAKVGVWEEPDPGAPTLGGAAVRALTLPQLFVAQPDGRWAASLAEPGSDRLAGDGLSATFRLRAGAVWSNGAPIMAEDLRRTGDQRFVAAVDGPAADGTLMVRFVHALPGWHRLWSGVDSVAAPAPGVWGGPFVVAERTAGLRVVLRRNDKWWGARPGGRPFLDEVQLVLVPDSTTARQLLDRGALDVLMPPAATVRTVQLRKLVGVHIDVTAAGGWSVDLRFGPNGLSKEQRRAVVGSIDRQRFVQVLLEDEATVPPWPPAPAATDFSALKGRTVDLVGENEEPMTALLQRAMQRRTRPGGGRIDLRNAEADRVEGWIAAGTYQVATVMEYDGPHPCWPCRWAKVDAVAALADQADTGDPPAVAALQAKLRDEALFLPLWHPKTVAAWRDGLTGVRANGFGLTAAWEAWEWRRPPPP